MLKNITISNFKSFANQCVDFKKLTVLSGLNSTGKSTVINSLLLPLQIDARDNLFLNGIYFNLGIFKGIFHQWAGDDIFSVQYNYNNESLDITTNYGSNNEDHDFITIKDGARFEGYRGKIRYISAERISPKLYFKGDTPDMSNEFIGVNGEYTISVLSSLKNKIIPIDSMKHEKSGSYTSPAMSLLANVNAWLDRISPNVTITPDMLNKVRLSTLEFGYENESTMTSVGSVNVGFGLTYVLPILVAGLLSKPEDILIIENPEAHLHPAGQRHIGSFLALLAANNVQVIIETHSDHVVNGIRIAIKEGLISSSDMDFLYFSKTEETNNSVKSLESKVTKVVVSDEGKILEAPQGFFDEWEEALYKLL
ncbi:TPA: DUF3696 domain-containing protein [Serratia marcescens]|uniref:AAA family ATPase n=1 Tax=Serratia TaxID=613 RepID=UPI0018D7AD16|nr:DUF3696 domain-containing protein [Serratia ureilytica]MBH2944452.1 DUF3696 domain-containing protein [Serratia ureilytica]MBH3322256.1 DUF3696 domain-containing protein [Serratia ureilytica]UAN27567.1 DUF3696 domain-containing protein [Serratia ureilytica]